MIIGTVALMGSAKAQKERGRGIGVANWKEAGSAGNAPIGLEISYPH